MTRPDNRLDIVQDEVDIGEAARRLDLSPETVRKRLQRGNLQGHKAPNGTWRVVLDTVRDKPGQGQDSHPPSPLASDQALIRRLEDEVAFLRAQLQTRDDEIKRAHVLIQQAQRTPELPTPRQPWWRSWMKA